MSTPSSDVSVRPRGASNVPSLSGPNAGVVVTSTGGLDVERLTGSIGAVVHGLDLSVPLAARDLEDLRELVAEHQVLFARDQHLDEEQHRTLANRFGALSIHPVDRLTGSGRAISVIDDATDRPPAGFDWHTDLSWTVEPPDLGFLSAVVVPPCGGDTLWASGRAIYERLDPARQRLCRSLRVVHVPDDTLLNTVRRHHGEDIVRRLIAEHPPIEQPLVRRHAETGRPAMWLSPLADLVLGHGPHTLRGMDFYNGRLIAYSLGNFGGGGVFGKTPATRYGVYLDVSLGRDGSFIRGRLRSVHFEHKAGKPLPDPDGRAARLIDHFSQRDFPDTAPQIDSDGTVAPSR